MFKNISGSLKFIVILLFTLLFIKIFNISYPLTVTSFSRSAEFAVIGEGKVEVRPDTALINVGVSVNNLPTVEDVQKSMNDSNNKIVTALRNMKVNQSDVKTSNYSIYPNYGPQGNAIIGYNGSINIDVKVRDTSKVAQVVQAATNAGANQVNNIQFTIDNPDKYRQQSRANAIKNAEEQAKTLSKELKIKLGKIVNMVESNNNQIGPYSQDYRGLGGGAGPEISPGTQTITSIVTLYFEKK